MPKHPNITINLPMDASNSDIVLTCLRAMVANNLGHELDAFARDIAKGGGHKLRTTASKWFMLFNQIRNCTLYVIFSGIHIHIFLVRFLWPVHAWRRLIQIPTD